MHALARQARHPRVAGRRPSEVGLVFDHDDRCLGKSALHRIEEMELCLERVAARLGRIEEKEDRIRNVGQGRDGLSLEPVAVLHRAVQEAWRVEDLVPIRADLDMAQVNPLGRERVRGDLRPARGHGTDERTLPDVRVAGDDHGPGSRVDGRNQTEFLPRGDEGIEVLGNLADNRREPSVGSFPEWRQLLRLRRTDPAEVLPGYVVRFPRGPLHRAEVLLQVVPIREGIDELPVEGREAVEAREASDGPPKGRSDRCAGHADAGRREVPGPRDAVLPLRRRLGRPCEGDIKHILPGRDGRQIEHGRANRCSGIRMAVRGRTG